MFCASFEEDLIKSSSSLRADYITLCNISTSKARMYLMYSMSESPSKRPNVLGHLAIAPTGTSPSLSICKGQL